MSPAHTSSAAATTVLHENGHTMGPPNGFSIGVAGPSSGGLSLHGGPSSSSSPSSSPAAGKAFAHIDDIKNVQLDVSPVTPIETLLRHTEESMKQARFAKDFGRLDVALKEHIKATMILAEVMPRNSAWMSVMADQKGARVRYNALMSQLIDESAAYDAIKLLIQKDNARTGVKPKHGANVAGIARANSQHGRAQSVAVNTNGHWPQVPQSLVGPGKTNGTATAAKSKPKPKPKPSIQPKPQSLQGNAIKPGGTPSASTGSTNGAKTAQDLAERFANLRTAKPAAEPQQDPRIRTQPISQTGFPQPQAQAQAQAQAQFQKYRAESRQAQPPPSTARPEYPMIGTLPDLPKVPDAIYSPARGSISSQSGQPPANAPKGMFSRTNSTTSFTGMTRTPAARPPSSEDYFALRTSLDRPPRPHPEPPAARKPRVSIPEGDTITVQELLKCMKAGSRDIQLLLIDIRSREEYDEGHILSQATICIESSTLQRENISAGDLADSMVLAPAAEKRLFDNRRDFDLVVYYDQDAEAMRLYGDDLSAAETAVVAMYNALAYYDFQFLDAENNKRPKLLKGGLDAWTSVMGAASLQTSSTVEGVAAAAARPRASTFTRHLSKYMTKPIQDAAEAQRWEENLKDMDKSGFVRTTDDFLRRFPPVSAIQESMTSPTSSADDAEQVSRQSTGRKLTKPPPPDLEPPASAAAVASMYSTLPPPPARPAPTVPKPCHGGVLETDGDDDDHYMRTKLAKAGAAGGTSAGRGLMRRQKVGLYNPGNWCYGNSSFQSLFASGSFSEELTTGEWATQWKVPMKSDEKINHPQLLTKILANSFYWMQFGKFEAMKPKMLMEYCYHIHQRDFDGSLKADRSTIFGGPYQQDAQEFISFLLTNLHDETNRLRDRTDEVPQPVLGPQSTALGNGLKFWEAYRRCNDSLVDRYWRGIEVTDRRCRSCGHPSLTYEPFDALHLPIPALPTTTTTTTTAGDSGTTMTTLADLLATYCGADLLPEYRCDECRRIDTTDKRARFVRLPELLCVSFRRFMGNEHSGFRKNNTAVIFPIDGLDMTPYTVQGSEEATATKMTDPSFAPPFLYDCYAVIVHSGTLRSGHYRAFVRDESAGSPAASGNGSNGSSGSNNKHQWHHFDDARVEPVTIGSGDGRDMARRLYRDNNQASAYVVFYKRRK